MESKATSSMAIVADLLVVAARVPRTAGLEGLALFTLDANAAGVERRLLESMDPTRKLARIDFRGAHADLLGNLDDGAKPLLRTLDQAAIALANEMVGGAQTMLDSAVSYAKLRVQFGRTIGSFQAIKHKCADLLLDVELAKSAAYYAAQAAAADDPGMARAGQSGQSGGVRNLPAHRGRMYSDSRRHRLHLG